jgi:hypothetical protein
MGVSYLPADTMRAILRAEMPPEGPAEPPWTLWLPRWHPPRLNQLLAGIRPRIRLKRECRDIILAAAIDAAREGCPPASERRRVDLEVIVKPGKRWADPDAYHKATLDALVHAAMLVDDSPEWCELGRVVYARSKDWGTKIVLGPAEALAGKTATTNQGEQR